MYRLFIDEVGHDNLNTANDPNEQFLCLMGVIVELDVENARLEASMNELKRRVFGTQRVVLHRREIIDKKPPPFDLLRDPQTRTTFDEGLITIFEECRYSVIAVQIDKKEHIERYKVWRSHPYHYCLKAMLERYVMHLSDLGSKGDVMAEWRGVQPNRKLEAAYKHIYTRGTDNLSINQCQKRLSSGQLKIQKKEANISGLQLADLLASPASRYLLCRRKNEEMKAPFGKQVIDVLRRSKFRRSPSGKLDGYGYKLLP